MRSAVIDTAKAAISTGEKVFSQIGKGAFGNPLGNSLPEQSSGELSLSERRNLDWDDPKMLEYRAKNGFGTFKVNPKPLAPIELSELPSLTTPDAQQLLLSLPAAKVADGTSLNNGGWVVPDDYDSKLGGPLYFRGPDHPGIPEETPEYSRAASKKYEKVTNFKPQQESSIFDILKKLQNKIELAAEQSLKEMNLLRTLSPDELRPFPLVLNKFGEAPLTFYGQEPPPPTFVLGQSAPLIVRGVGSGEWGVDSPTASKVSLKVAAQIELATLTSVFPDAARHMQHFFENTGTDYQVDLKRIVETTDAGRELYLSQRTAAIKYAVANAVDGVPLSFVSSKLEQRAFAEGNENWFYASGGFSGYSRSTVTKNGDQFSMKFELNFVDPYNWDRGQTNLGGFNVKDSFMADFHRQGIAKDFMLVGKLPLTISWSSGGEWNPTVKVDSQKL